MSMERCAKLVGNRKSEKHDMSLWKHLKSDQAKEEYIRRRNAMPDLPARWDFHLATKDLPLTTAQRSQVQMAFSKLNKQQIKDTIAELKEMRFQKIREGEYKMAAFCKATYEFGEKYLMSLEWQKKV